MKHFGPLLLALAFFSCNDPALSIQGKYIDDFKIDQMEVRKVENNHYTVGNKVSQLHLYRFENELKGVTSLGDSVRMKFFTGDSAHYFIMGTQTTYNKTGELEGK